MRRESIREGGSRIVQLRFAQAAPQCKQKCLSRSLECRRPPPDVQFTANQKRKGAGRPCKTCVLSPELPPPDTVAAPPIRPSAHLCERQRLRRIADTDLDHAVAHGDRRTFPDDGAVHYTHKNVCYVVRNGAGVTDWRLHPAQCVCAHSAAELARARGEEDAAAWGDDVRPYDRVI